MDPTLEINISLCWYCVNLHMEIVLQPKLGCLADSMVGPNSAVLLQLFLLKIGPVRNLDTIVLSGRYMACSHWHLVPMKSP